MVWLWELERFRGDWWRRGDGAAAMEDEWGIGFVYLYVGKSNLDR